jgi:hypothetical protein
MRRIDWVRDRLENWARWSMQREDGLGYPSQSAFARLGVPSSKGSDYVPTNNIDASEINDMVNGFRLSRSHLYLVLQLHYAKGYQINRVAKMMSKSERSIREHLCEADAAIAFALSEKRSRMVKV